MNKFKKRKEKRKNLSSIICEIDNHPLTSTIRVKLQSNGSVYIIHFLVYKQHHISLNKKYSGVNQCKNGINNKIRDKDRENKIRTEMRKNRNVCVKDISKSTGFNVYIINRFYMKIRREIST